MTAMKILPALFLLGVAASFGATGPPAQSAQPASQTVSKTAAARVPYSVFNEIHVDDRCRLLPNPALRSAGGKKPHLRKDPVICHLESLLTSGHMEESMVGNEVHRSWVSIREQEYVLQNIAPVSKQFIVEQFVPNGWVVDSDPQPGEMAGATAIFRVQAEPGQVVRLHVGIRRTKALRPKLIGMRSPAPSEMLCN